MLPIPVSEASRPVVVPLELGAARGVFQIRGPLRIDWAARLSSQLARRGVTIGSLTARRGSTGWFAEMDMASDSTPIDELDLLALLEESAPVYVPETLTLSLARIEPRKEHGGSLLLTAEGVDCVGFLAALLDTLAFQSLFPVEIHARTFGSVAVDGIWIRGLGYEVPSPGAEQRLARALDSLRGERTGKRLSEPR
jgi:hypothetical protein